MPTPLKILRGNPGKRALNQGEPKPSPGDLEPPTWLHGDALEEWDRLAPTLHRLGLLTEIDGRALASYCQTWARWREAEAKIEEFGMVIKGATGFPIISPFVAVANPGDGADEGVPLIEFAHDAQFQEPRQGEGRHPGRGSVYRIRARAPGAVDPGQKKTSD